MAKTDLKGAQARANAAPQAKIRPGAVYRILDEVISWPENRRKSGGHKHRRVILLQDEELCRPNTGPRTVMVIPCSSSGPGGAAPWDFLLPEGENGFDKDRIIALVSLVQPILKKELLEHLGHVSKSTLDELKARAQLVLAIQRMPAKLPSRDLVNGHANSAQQMPVPPGPLASASIASAALFSASKEDPPK